LSVLLKVIEDHSEKAFHVLDLHLDVGMEDQDHDLGTIDSSAEVMEGEEDLQVQVNLLADLETTEEKCTSEEDHDHLLLIDLDLVHQVKTEIAKKDKLDPNREEDVAAHLRKKDVNETRFNEMSATIQLKNATDLQNALAVEMTATPV